MRLKEYNMRAITVASRDSGEKDVYATLYSLERGRVSLMVKGTKKTVSSLRGAAGLLNLGESYAVNRRGADLLTEWLPLNSFPVIKGDLEKAALACYFARFAAQLTADLEPEPKFYYLFENILNILQRNGGHDIIRMVFEWGFLDIFGQAFEFDACADCGGRLGRQSRAFLDVPGGEVLCGKCSEESGAANMYLGLGLADSGKLIKEASAALSGGLLSGEELDGMAGARIKRLEEIFNERGPGAAGPLQAAFTRFLKYHVSNEYSDSWMVRFQ